MASTRPEKVESASPRPSVPGCLSTGCCPGLWRGRAGGQRRGAGGGALPSCAHARTGPGAEAHHHLPAGRQPSFQLVAALHPRRGSETETGPLPGPRLTWTVSSGCGQASLVGTSPLGCPGIHCSTAHSGVATVTSTGEVLRASLWGGPAVGTAGTRLGCLGGHPARGEMSIWALAPYQHVPRPRRSSC